ncbi:hypothetical protein [Croceicoccus sediminis]|uniref:hypothetical protein n=1 Tax=Croceicoccus sediminis TaxID=2571150 RepID=UPI00196B790D|nr:hypothetical protein [Croceicoccus sediminis]
MKNHTTDLNTEEKLTDLRECLSQSLAKLDELGFDLAALKIAEALDLIAEGGK